MAKAHTLWFVLALAATTVGCGMTTPNPGGYVSGGSIGLRAPDFAGGVAWINSKPLSIRDLKDKVVLVDFWEYTCVNCIRTLPYLKSWHEKYADAGLVIVGVHTPEFSFAQDAAEVEAAVGRFGIAYPVVVDSDHAIWNAYANRWWPRKFLVDRDGVIRYDHIGEGGYHETEREIQRLLKQVDPSLTFPPLTELVSATDVPGAVCYPITPELYCGYLRARLGNPDGFFEDMTHTYTDPGASQGGVIYLHGAWRVDQESAEYQDRPGAGYIAIRFRAAEVNAVFKRTDTAPVDIVVTFDGQPVPPAMRGEDVTEKNGRTVFTVNEARMYRILAGAYGEHELRLSPQGPGVAIFAYTFGTACVAPPGG